MGSLVEYIIPFRFITSQKRSEPKFESIPENHVVSTSREYIRTPSPSYTTLNTTLTDINSNSTSGVDTTSLESVEMSGDHKHDVTFNLTHESPTPTNDSAQQSDLALLAKLEEANRMLEKDGKARSCLTPPKQLKGHSRQASVSSVASNVSQCSSVSNIDFEPVNAEELWNLWSKIVSDWDNIYKKKTSYVKELVMKGVPNPFRGIVWQLLCNAHHSGVKAKYCEYLRMTSPMEKLIRRDITRTYPEHHFFKEKNGLGQESLFNVMKAYSLHDREVGYCQGSGFIVGLLLMQMPEEEAFAVLVKIMQDFRMRELFKPSMAELGVCMFQLECLIQEFLPTLYSHFQTQSVSVTMFASSWFLTIYTTSLPLSLACRVYDIFLIEGTEFIFRVAIALLTLCHDTLLSLDMEGVIKLFQKETLTAILEQNTEQLITTATSLKLSSKKLKKLEKEYNTLKTKETEDQVEIRRLRTENRLLRQRVDNLEKETATLADRLIHDQVKCAQQDEQILTLRKDLSRSRTESSQANMKVEEVTEQYENLRRSNSSASSQTSSEGSLPEADQTRVHKLQQENTELRARDTDNTSLIKQLRTKLNELESRADESMQPPSEELQSMQEELIACKLREAEANLSLKELQQKVIELKQHWQRHMDKLSSCNPLSKAPKNEVRLMSDEVMSVRIREAQAVAELKDAKQRVMEMETKNHIGSRQVKRLEEENQRLRDELEEAATHQRMLRDQLQDAQRKTDAHQSQVQEEEMMQRIRDAEHSQLIAVMRQRIAELEIQTQEIETAGQLRGESGDLQNRIAELQDEVLQLKMSKRLGSLSAMVQDMSLESESECDDDLETHIRTHELTLTESCCGFLPQGEFSNSHHQRPTYLEDSSGDDTVEEGACNNSKVKRRQKVDLDKTPTQDISSEFFLSGEINIAKNYDSVESNETCDSALSRNNDSSPSSSEINDAPSSQNLNSDKEAENPLAGLKMDSSVFVPQTANKSDTNNQTNS